ncbi:MAG: NHLP family bacteriocin export ABC transporter peptidase/permease/ATPase subunit [Chroococcidiopsidaceae cyanobacterium CP_BM_ER_R8_30]|nr:NHLP family bacteriocin export ABC transporter peptidase/permease/ATPase subunit [Chroococcidiopsidaceae cyanobacterium CP_BM_ER_R8_30]
MWKPIIKRLKPQSKRVIAPTILQMEAVECGAAALAIILSYYGRFVPLTELRQACGVSRDGSKASKMVRAARRYGMEAQGYKYELEDLITVEPPYIVFWNFNHFVVVEGFHNNKVYISDPAVGRRHISLQEFDEGFTGVVLMIRPGATFRKGGSKRRLIPSLYKRLQSSQAALLGCLLAGLYLSIPKLALPVFTGQFVDQVLGQQREDWLRPLLLGIGLAGLLIFAIQETQLRYLRRLKIKLGISMSEQFFWHALRLPMEFYAQRFAGEISNRLNLNDDVASTLSGQLATTTIDIIMMIVFGIVMAAYSPALTLIAFLFAAMSFLALQWVSRQRIDANMSLVQDQGKVAAVAISGLQSIESLKASGLESDFFSRWAGYYTKATNSQQELSVQTQALGVLPSLLTNLANMAVLVLGGLSVMEGQLSLGGLVAFQLLLGQFLSPISSLVTLGQQLQELVGNIDRLDDVLENPVDRNLQDFQEQLPIQQIKVSRDSTRFNLQGYVDLNQVTFGYSPLDPPLIENFSLSIEPGQRVALVGSSGSGKSTIANIVAGLYQPFSGEILFDGKPRHQIPRSVLTGSLAMVAQDIFLFSGTVRDNLTLWDTTVSDRNLVRACKDAAIHDIIVALPRGYDAELLEGGTNLSGGQRQRLEIARALVNNPTILIMDEATSALDAETEQIIFQNLNQRSCTCIIVAHRLSTIRDCNEIIVLERGKVVQRGTHEELWQQQGLYADLIRSEGEALNESQ